jgi:predicted TIM-barrel fold metal-dependent hydrolase
MDLSGLPVIDGHAHSIFHKEALVGFPYASAFTEGYDPEIVNRHARETLFYRRSLRDIAELFGCEAIEEVIVNRRNALGFERTAALCFKAARLEAAFLDDGFLAEKCLPWDEHERFVPVRRILRIEHLAEKLISSCADFSYFIERFLAEIDPPPSEVVALKSIAAYRTGLDVAPPGADLAKKSFEALKDHTGKDLRLTDKPLIDYLLSLAVDAASRHDIPLQIHTGFGDPDLDLKLSNPLHLRPIFEARREAPVVLLHAGYPFVREAGYLASVYPKVHVDFGLAVPFLSIGGMKRVVRELLELAPVTKIMYSSDAHIIPELFYLGAKWGRAVLADVLEEAVRDSDLSAAEADRVAEAILGGNARRLYLGSGR